MRRHHCSSLACLGPAGNAQCMHNSIIMILLQNSAHAGVVSVSLHGSQGPALLLQCSCQAFMAVICSSLACLGPAGNAQCIHNSTIMISLRILRIRGVVSASLHGSQGPALLLQCSCQAFMAVICSSLACLGPAGNAQCIHNSTIMISLRILHMRGS